MKNYIVKNGDPYITSKILRYKPSEISKKKLLNIYQFLILLQIFTNPNYNYNFVEYSFL